MDRFIVDGYTTVPYWQGSLKSNMDRFIANPLEQLEF